MAYLKAFLLGSFAFLLSGVSYAALTCGPGPDGESTVAMLNIYTGRQDCITAVTAISSSTLPSGSTNYIQNTSTAQVNSQFNVSTMTASSTFNSGIVSTQLIQVANGNFMGSILPTSYIWNTSGPTAYGTRFGIVVSTQGYFNGYAPQTSSATAIMMNPAGGASSPLISFYSGGVETFQTAPYGTNWYVPTTFGSDVLLQSDLSVNGSYGTSGQFLQTQGVGSPAVWATVSGMTPNSTFYIQNTNSLQSGATFYVSSGTVNGQLTAVASGATVKPLVVQGAGSQTADLQDWDNSAGTELGGISSGGQLAIAGDGSGHLEYMGYINTNEMFLQPYTLFHILKGTAYTSGNRVGNYSDAIFNMDSNGAIQIGAGVGASAIGSLTFRDWNNTTAQASIIFNTAGSVMGIGPATTSADNKLRIGAVTGWPYSWSATQNINLLVGGSESISAGSSSTVPLVVQGAASQTADLQEWQNSSRVVLAAVNSSGTFIGDGIYGSMYVSIGTNTVGTSAAYVTNTASTTFNVMTNYSSTGVVSGLLNGFTFQSSSASLTALVAGTYEITYSVTLNSGYNTLVTIMDNGVIKNNFTCGGYLGSTVNDFSCSGSGIIYLNVNDYIQWAAAIETGSGTHNLYFDQANMSIKRVGN